MDALCALLDCALGFFLCYFLFGCNRLLVTLKEGTNINDQFDSLRAPTDKGPATAQIFGDHYLGRAWLRSANREVAFTPERVVNGKRHTAGPKNWTGTKKE